MFFSVSLVVSTVLSMNSYQSSFISLRYGLSISCRDVSVCARVHVSTGVCVSDNELAYNGKGTGLSARQLAATMCHVSSHFQEFQ